jgi:hypothetical protein
LEAALKITRQYAPGIIRDIPSYQKDAYQRCGADAWHRLSRSTQHFLEAFPDSNPCFDWSLSYAIDRLDGAA